MAAASPIDPAPLAELSAGDEGILHEVFRQFRQVNDQDAALLRSAVRDRDLKLVAHASHRIKGAGRTVGANELAQASEHIEDAARCGDWTSIEGGMAAFDSALARVNAYLDSAAPPGGA